MDKEKFIKKAKEYGYSNGEIKEMIKNYENLKKDFEELDIEYSFDPINDLIDWYSVNPSFPTYKPCDICHHCPHFFRYPDCPSFPDFEKCPRKEILHKSYYNEDDK